MAEHKHAAVLRAIADGKTVQWKSSTSEWFDGSLTLNPLAHPMFEWRVKPEPKPDVVRYAVPHAQWGWSTLQAAKELYVDPSGFLRITIDGETGKLKSVEIVE